MKKLFCILLTIAMLLSLCACGKDTAKDDDDNDNIRGTITTDPTETTAPGNQQSDNTPEFSLGKTSGGTYTNDFLGLTFNLPIGWEFYTEKQIMDLNNIAAEYMDDSVVQQLKNATIIYDMYAMQSFSGSNVNITLEKITPAQKKALNLKVILENQIPTMKSTFSNMGLADIKINYQKITVNGKEFDGITVSAKWLATASTHHQDFYEKIIVFNKGDYLAYVTAACIQKDNTDYILSCISFT